MSGRHTSWSDLQTALMQVVLNKVKSQLQLNNNQDSWRLGNLMLVYLQPALV